MIAYPKYTKLNSISRPAVIKYSGFSYYCVEKISESFVKLFMVQEVYNKLTVRAIYFFSRNIGQYIYC